jgi:RNA polymerase II C-terminal domain phosphatase-like 3/4
MRSRVQEFLAAANEMFQLYIYTMGDRSYALEMASILDPGRIYFDGPERIIGRVPSPPSTQERKNVQNCLQ